MIFTASTVSDTKWKIIAAAMAEKAKPTVLERLAAMKITIDTATQWLPRQMGNAGARPAEMPDRSNCGGTNQ